MLLGWLVINGLYLAVALWHSGTLAVTYLLPVRYVDLKSAKSARVSSDFLIKAIFDFGNKSISLTDIARYRNSDDPRFAIQNWMRNRNTIGFLGLWETLHNPNFNRVQFDTFDLVCS